MQTEKVLLRQMALEHHGGAQGYQFFKRTIEASPLLYRQDLDVYTDQVSQRHLRNIAQIKYLQQLIKQGKISTEMLSSNVFNTYYPSYVLHHHYQVFLPLLARNQQSQAVKQLTIQARDNQITGALFHQTIRTDLKGNGRELPVIQNGIVFMDQATYFYSAVTSPYITHSAFLSQSAQGLVLTVVKIRDYRGQLVQEIRVKDLGQLISKDYLTVGYNFSKVKPLLNISLEPKQLKSIQSSYLKQEIAEFNFSLKDFQKALWVTIRYTSMRKQFKTIEGSREERPIISYQAVAARIINAFSQFQALSDLSARMMSNSHSEVLFGNMVKSAHHTILEHLINLRECCGGFGYLQVAGHAGGIERSCNRAGRQSSQYPALSREYLKAVQFFTGSQQIEKHYTQEIKSKDVTFMQYFSVFLSICTGMRCNREELKPREFRREFLRQTSIIAMHGREQFLRHEGSNVHCQMLQYHMLGYISKNSAFVNWDLVKIGRKEFFEQLNICRTECLNRIVPKLEVLCCSLQLSFLRNTIVGRQNSDQFYTELVESAKSNRRNSQEYVDYIQAPIIQMMTENRARL